MGQSVYEKAERGHEASVQPVVENPVQERRREHYEMKGEPG